MKNNDPYYKYMNQVWEAKEKIYQDTREMTDPEYWAYIRQLSKDFRDKHKDKYVKQPSTTSAGGSSKAA